jgi:exopolyphosphatase/guanosine-5'-triphosphate,3'-diphosphate pyrophosphatase
MTGEPVAAVDCGTNSTRLLVLDGSAKRLDRRMQITRLGEGVDQYGELSAPAIRRTLEVLQEYRGVLDGHGVVRERIRVAATSATRDARNAEVFLNGAEAVLGVRPEVIGGEQEGRLSWRGATAGLAGAMSARSGEEIVVVDVGGGSTELITGRLGESSPEAVESMDVGCVRVSERFLRHDPPEPGELEAARAVIREHVSSVRDAAAGHRRPATLVGLAGTVSALTVMALGLEAFDEGRVHHARLSLSTVNDLTNQLASLSLADRRGVHGMEVERADVLVGGALVLAEVMSVFGFDELIASEADILDGMALELLERLDHPVGLDQRTNQISRTDDAGDGP